MSDQTDDRVSPGLEDNIWLEPSPHRPSSEDLFAGMTREEQDAAFGPEVAEAVRQGKVELSDLVRRNQHPTGEGFITQATASDLGLGD